MHDVVVPHTGHYLNGSVEVALPPGTAQFVKAELTTQLHHSFGKVGTDGAPPGLLGSLVGNIGAMLPLGKVLPALATANNGGRYKSFLSDR